MNKGKTSVLAAVAVLAAAGIYSWGPQSGGPLISSGWHEVPGAIEYRGQVEMVSADGDTALFAFSTTDTTVWLPVTGGEAMRVRTQSVRPGGLISDWSDYTNWWQAPAAIHKPTLEVVPHAEG
jgi:hypothetical protein